LSKVQKLEGDVKSHGTSADKLKELQKENIPNFEGSDVMLSDEVSKGAFGALKGLVIEVEGNIGSGKSTLTEAMKRHINAENEDNEFSAVFGEKVNNTFLGAFYSNCKRFSFAFQMYMLTTRLYQMDESSRQAKHEQRLVFLDRGAVGDTLFAIQNFKIGNMDEQELEIYRSVCRERLPASLSDKVDMVLYLDVEPSECHRRMSMLRKRDAEEGIPLSYLEGIDSCYFHLIVNWLGERKDGLYDMNIGKAPPIVILPWTKFGNTAEALAALEKLQAGHRRSPTVKFQPAKPASGLGDAVLLDSIEDMNKAYELLKSSGRAAASCNAYVNWALEHSNAFKRVVMAFLIACGTVVFYGEQKTGKQEKPAESNCPAPMTTSP